MAAFAFLHAAQSPALLRRIERPALPEDALRALGRALVAHRRCGTACTSWCSAACART